jgi:hypothetical protein
MLFIKTKSQITVMIVTYPNQNTIPEKTQKIKYTEPNYKKFNTT